MGINYSVSSSGTVALASTGGNQNAKRHARDHPSFADS
jgi:hypothetical protein